MLSRTRAEYFLGLTTERIAKGAAGARKRDAVLGALGPGEAWFDRREVELDVLLVDGFARGLVVPDALCLGVGLDEFELRLGTTSEGQVVNRDLVDREDGAGRAVFG